MSEHIINIVDNYTRLDDYDYHNDYYVNPEWKRKCSPRFPSVTQDEEENNDIGIR